MLALIEIVRRSFEVFYPLPIAYFENISQEIYYVKLEYAVGNSQVPPVDPLILGSGKLLNGFN